MKKRCLIFITYILCLFSFGILNVKANIQFYTDKDFVQLTFVGNGVSSLGFYLGNGSAAFNQSSMIRSNTWNGISDTTTAAVSLRNGTYTAWVWGSDSRYYHKVITVSNSCTNEASKLNQTGSFTVERCFVKKFDSSQNKYTVTMEGDSTAYSCASGYKLTQYSLKENTCSVGLNGLPFRYCKGVFSGTCSVDSSSGGGNSGGGNSGGGSGGGGSSVAAPTLSALSLSGASISPSFKSGTTKYTANVAADVTSITVNATASSGNSLVSGYGSRTVNLNYGANNVYVKVKNSAGTTKTYTITVNRADNRSTVNTLSNLTISSGTLSPVFSSSVTNYTVDVGFEVELLTIDATLTDGKSKFAPGFGPSTVTLQEGVNKVFIKVVSENGVTNVYNITVNRGSLPSECATDTDNLALIKSIQLVVPTTGDIIEIENFDPTSYTYSDIKVPNVASSLSVEVNTVDEADKELIEIEGAEDLKVGTSMPITIKVTSSKCPNNFNLYTLNVVRQDEEELNSDATLKSLTIKGYDDFEFTPNGGPEYDIKLKKGDTELDIEFETASKDTTCDVLGNKDLEYGSKINIKCTAPSGDVEDYYIVVDEVEKGANVFLIVLLVIVIIIILIYLVLRLLGYRIYFNTAMIGSFFRGITGKDKE